VHRFVTPWVLAAGIGVAMGVLGRPERPASAAPANTRPATLPAGFEGRVVDGAGKAVEGAFVSVLGSLGSGGLPRLSGGARSAADGHFVAGVTPAEPPRGPAGAPPLPPEIFADVPGVGVSKPVRGKPGPNVTLTLLPPIRLQLTLLGPDGKPAAGVRVLPRLLVFWPEGASFRSVLSFPPEASRRWAVTSDAQGRCVFRGLPRGARARFDTDDERFAAMSGGDMLTLEGDPVARPAPIRLLAAATISGRVRYGESNKPAGRIEVDAQSVNGQATQGAADALSDADGHFRLTRLKPGRYVVSYGNEDEPGEWTAHAAEVDVAEGGQATADLSLIRGGIIKGRLFDRSTSKGLPHLGIGLHGPARPMDAAGIQLAFTDAEGHYTLRVPPGKQFVYFFGPVPDGYREPEDASPMHLKELEVDDGQTVTFDFALRRDDTPPIEGVVLGPDGKPVPGATIVIDSLGYPPMDQQLTADPQGRFRLTGVKPGAELRVRAKGLATLAAYRVEANDRQITLHVSPDASYAAIVNVTDRRGGVVPGAAATLMTSHGQYGTGGFPHPTGTDGTARIEPLYFDTRYSVSASAPGFGVEYAEVAPPQTGRPRERRVSIKLDGADSVIAGVVVDDHGKPVPDVELLLNGSKTGVMHTRSDRKGNFRFKVVSEASGVVYVNQPGGLLGKKPPNVIAHAGETDVWLQLPPDHKPADATAPAGGR
jgi:hypothetical protein